MDDYGFDYRCFNCDSRWCNGNGCRTVGNVYAPLWGWVSPDEARIMEADGAKIYWHEEVK
jgi:hypothetical protein